MAERQEIDNDLRHQLKETEAYVHSLKAALAEALMVIESVPTNVPGIVGTGATQSWP